MSGRDTEAMTTLSVADAIDDFLEEVERGSARDRHNRPFTPDDAQAFHWSLLGHVSEELGALRLGDVRGRDVEELDHELADLGIGLHRRRAVADSVRALFDHAEGRGLVDDNPAEWISPSEEDREEAKDPRSESTPLDQAISLGLRAGTVGFLLIALIFISQSL